MHPIQKAPSCFNQCSSLQDKSSFSLWKMSGLIGTVTYESGIAQTGICMT